MLATLEITPEREEMIRRWLSYTASNEHLSMLVEAGEREADTRSHTSRVCYGRLITATYVNGSVPFYGVIYNITHLPME